MISQCCHDSITQLLPIAMTRARANLNYARVVFDTRELLRYMYGVVIKMFLD